MSSSGGGGGSGAAGGVQYFSGTRGSRLVQQRAAYLQRWPTTGAGAGRGGASVWDLSMSSVCSPADLAPKKAGEGDPVKALLEALTAAATAAAGKPALQMRELYLGDNRIGPEGCYLIACAFRTCPAFHSLRVLNLCSNRFNSRCPSTVTNFIGDKGAGHLANVLCMEKLALTELNIGYNSIGVEGARALAEALRVNITLRVLNAPGNKFGDAGVIALAGALKESNSIESLNVASNGVGFEGIVALCSALQSNSTLTSLSIQYNNCGPQGAQHIAALIKGNSRIVELNLGGTVLENAGAAAVATAACCNSSLKKLVLSFNGINDGCIKELSSLLESSPAALTAIDLSGNALTDNDGRRLRKALASNNSLRHFLLARNKIVDQSIVDSITKLLADAAARPRSSSHSQCKTPLTTRSTSTSIPEPSTSPTVGLTDNPFAHPLRASLPTLPVSSASPPLVDAAVASSPERRSMDSARAFKQPQTSTPIVKEHKRNTTSPSPGVTGSGAPHHHQHTQHSRRHSSIQQQEHHGTGTAERKTSKSHSPVPQFFTPPPQPPQSMSPAANRVTATPLKMEIPPPALPPPLAPVSDADIWNLFGAKGKVDSPKTDDLWNTSIWPDPPPPTPPTQEVTPTMSRDPQTDSFALASPVIKTTDENEKAIQKLLQKSTYMTMRNIKPVTAESKPKEKSKQKRLDKESAANVKNVKECTIIKEATVSSEPQTEERVPDSPPPPPPSSSEENTASSEGANEGSNAGRSTGGVGTGANDSASDDSDSNSGSSSSSSGSSSDEDSSNGSVIMLDADGNSGSGSFGTGSPGTTASVTSTVGRRSRSGSSSVSSSGSSSGRSSGSSLSSTSSTAKKVDVLALLAASACTPRCSSAERSLHKPQRQVHHQHQPPCRSPRGQPLPPPYPPTVAATPTATPVASPVLQQALTPTTRQRYHFHQHQLAHPSTGQQAQK
eukprot:TRINITY_DN603_c2_g1_i1.p1 TRINITY_DN603_c2_g1~~TRINITY_DN603_c2_g1_i1.p1  ORF type:complete len:968 (+),score=210.65 TRINITY_DN603_c2_g1_i1:40-2904(+)